jgi:hypothetical protein
MGAITDAIRNKYNLLKESEGWLNKLIRCMANASFELWTSRNECKHGRDNSKKYQASLVQSHRDIKALYLLRNKVLPHDCELFRPTLEEHLSDTLPQLKSWILHNKKLIEFSVRKAQAESKSQTKCIQTYFKPKANRQKKKERRPKPTQTPPQRPLRTTRITNHFQMNPTSPSQLPCIPEQRPIPTITDRIIHVCSRLHQRYLADFFPDHPS